MKYFHIRNKLFSSRSKSLIKNQLLIVLNRPFSIIANFLLVPLTINFVSSELYGLWLTIQSVVMWVTYFDFGLANGFKNRFAEAKAVGNSVLAKKLVSTTYFLLFLMFSSFVLLFLIINYYWINWAQLLNLNENMNDITTRVFCAMILFFAFFCVLNVLNALLAADQKIAMSSIITTIGQILSLLFIFVLSFFIKGDIYILVFITSGIPCLVLLLFSLYYFSTSYKEYRPSIKFVDIKLFKSVLGLGFKFFVIQLSLLLIFQLMNLFLMRNHGGEAVTLYNVAFRYYNIIYMITNIIISPLWPAFTDAYQKQDYRWMANIYNKLSTMWWISIPTVVLMLIVAPYVFHLWLGDNIIVPFHLSLCVAVYILLMSRANLFMYMINGIGAIKIQLLGYLIIAFISIPAIDYTSRVYGVGGIIIVPSIAYFVQSILCQIQLKKILNKKASGIWLK